MSTPIELVFKTVDGLDISLDVYLPSNASRSAPAAILLWWHGGGLLQGTRKGTVPHLETAPEKHGLCVVSADYRLAPQSKLPDILSDSKAALDFIQSTTFLEAVEYRAKPTKIILSGSSAGGYLALLTGTGIGFAASGLEVPSPVLGIAAIYPITDLDDPFWSTKQQPVPVEGRIIEREELEPFLDPDGEVVSSSLFTGARGKFYFYMLQEAILASLLLGDTKLSSKTFSIAGSIRSGQVSQVPPVWMIHGNIDDMVPLVQATDVRDAMVDKGFSVKLEIVDGVNHRFDMDPQYGLEGMYAFIRELVA